MIIFFFQEQANTGINPDGRFLGHANYHNLAVRRVSRGFRREERVGFLSQP